MLSFVSSSRSFLTLVSIILCTFSILLASPVKRIASAPQNRLMKSAADRSRHNSTFKSHAAPESQSAKVNEILDQVWVPDQTLPEKGAWVDSAKSVILWKGELDTAEEDYILLANSTWTKIQTLRIAYTDKDSVSDLYSQKWVADSSNWLDYYDESYTYDPAKGYLTQDYVKLNYQLFDSVNADQYPAGLTDYQKFLYTYNAGGQVTQVLLQEVLSADFTLTDYLKDLITYDANNNITLDSLKVYVSSVWADSQFTKYTYNAKNQIVQDSMCNYRRSNRTWTPYSKHVYTYTAFDSVATITLKRYKNLRWVDTLMGLFQYDNKNLESKSTVRVWNTDSSKWLNVSCDSFVYSGSDIKEVIYQEDTAGSWVNKSRSVYNYETAINNRERKNDITGLCAGMTILPDGRVRFVLTEPATVSATIYDLKGKVLRIVADKQAAPQGVNVLSLNSTINNGKVSGPGVYFCQLKINDARLSKKIVLLK